MAIGHEIQEVSSERAVYKYMMEDYRRSVRPVRNDADAVDLKIDLRLRMLEDLVGGSMSVFTSPWH